MSPTVVLVDARQTPRSAAFALTVLRALLAWLVDQHYIVINPFADVAVRGARPRAPFDTARALGDRERKTVRGFASRLDRHGWTVPAAQRLRFVLDFGYAKGLRASELVGAKLDDVERDQHGASCLDVAGKGTKTGRVALPPLAMHSLRQYLKERHLPVTCPRWMASTHWSPRSTKAK